MSRLPETTIFQVVVNARGQQSIWRDDRSTKLPVGWSFTSFKGSKDACLQHIAANTPATEPAPATPTPPPATATRPAVPTTEPRRVTALPFPQPSATMRLFVFPHAGSGASYYHFLCRALRADPIEAHIIQYPGREMRMRERPLDRMEAMVDLLAHELPPLLEEKPYAFFGHSMGSLTAFELTRRLVQLGLRLPRHLFLSGRQAAHLPGHVLHVDRLNDTEFLDAVGRRYNALPPELLAHREILELILPSLRADFTLMERYIYRAAPILDIDATLLNGRDDPWVNPPSLAAWQQHFARPIRQHLFPGGHFYLPEVAQELRSLALATLMR